MVELHNWFCSGCEKFVEAAGRNYESARRKHVDSVHRNIHRNPVKRELRE